MKALTKEHGFGAVGVIVSLVVVGLVGFAGWYVWQSRNADDKTDSKASNSETTKPNTDAEPALPEGYRTYKNSAGFEFAYPEAYGDFTAEDETTFTSATPDPAFLDGVDGNISVAILEPGTSFGTVKYGPQVKFVDGELIVQEINPADELNEVGKPYKGWLTTQDVVKQVNGLKVYVIQGGDEGRTSTKYAFVLNDKVVVISLSTFYDGTALCPDPPCEANDKTKYDSFVQTVLGSIRKL